MYIPSGPEHDDRNFKWAFSVSNLDTGSNFVLTSGFQLGCIVETHQSALSQLISSCRQTTSFPSTTISFVHWIFYLIVLLVVHFLSVAFRSPNVQILPCFFLTHNAPHVLYGVAWAGVLGDGHTTQFRLLQPWPQVLCKTLLMLTCKGIRKLIASDSANRPAFSL
jgi:hypothetical protein